MTNQLHPVPDAEHANRIVRELARQEEQDSDTGRQNRRGLVEEEVTRTRFEIIRWERGIGDDDEAVIFDDPTAVGCRKITVTWARQAVPGASYISVTVRAVHGTIQTGAMFVSCETLSTSLTQAVTATYLNRSIAGSQVTVETPFTQAEPGRADQLVAAIAAIARDTHES